MNFIKSITESDIRTLSTKIYIEIHFKSLVIQFPVICMSIVAGIGVQYQYHDLPFAVIVSLGDGGKVN